jgi:hypothetical protein
MGLDVFVVLGGEPVDLFIEIVFIIFKEGHIIAVIIINDQGNINIHIDRIGRDPGWISGIQIIIFVLLLGAVIALVDVALQALLVRLPAMLLGR